MISGFNTLVACLELLLFGGFVGGFIYTLNKFFPPFKKWFDKLVEGEL